MVKLVLEHVHYKIIERFLETFWDQIFSKRFISMQVAVKLYRGFYWVLRHSRSQIFLNPTSLLAWCLKRSTNSSSICGICLFAAECCAIVSLTCSNCPISAECSIMSPYTSPDLTAEARFIQQSLTYLHGFHRILLVGTRKGGGGEGRGGEGRGGEGRGGEGRGGEGRGGEGRGGEGRGGEGRGGEGRGGEGRGGEGRGGEGRGGEGREGRGGEGRGGEGRGGEGRGGEGRGGEGRGEEERGEEGRGKEGGEKMI